MPRAELQAVITAKDKASKTFRKLSGEMKKTQKTTNETRKGFAKLVGTVKGLGAMRLTAALGGLFAVRKAGMFAVDAAKDFMVFEKAMRNVNTMMRLNEKQFKAMSKEVLNLSKIVPYTAEELSEGLYKVVSAGISAENQMAFLGVAAKLATAGATDMSIAVSGLTSVIKGFSLAESDATKIAGLFAKANEEGMTTIGEMASSIQLMTAAAIKSGMAIEQVMTFMGTFTGITGSASEVATQFKAAMDAMAAPSVRSIKYIKELNKTLGDNAIKFGKGAFETENFAEKSRKLWKAVNEDAAALRRLIPSTEATALVIAAATTQFDKFNSLLGEMSDEDGNIASFNKMFMENMKSQQNQLKLTANAWGAFKIKIGKSLSGSAIWLSKFGMNIVDWFSVIGKSLVATGSIIILNFQRSFKIWEVWIRKAGDAIIFVIDKIRKFVGTKPVSFDFDVAGTVAELNIIDQAIISVGDDAEEIAKKFSQIGMIGYGAEFAKFNEMQKKIAEAFKDASDRADVFGNKSSEAAEKTKNALELQANELDRIKTKLQDIQEQEKKNLSEFIKSQARRKQSFEENMADMIYDAEQKRMEVSKEISQLENKDKWQKKLSLKERARLTELKKEARALYKEVAIGARALGMGVPGALAPGIAAIAERGPIERAAQAFRAEQAEETVALGERQELLARKARGEEAKREVVMNFDFRNAVVADKEFFIKTIMDAINRTDLLTAQGAL